VKLNNKEIVLENIFGKQFGTSSILPSNISRFVSTSLIAKITHYCQRKASRASKNGGKNR